MAEPDPTPQLVVEVSVRDLDRSLKFYRALGSGLVRRTGGFAVLSWDATCCSSTNELGSGARRRGASQRVMVPDEKPSGSAPGRWERR